MVLAKIGNMWDRGSTPAMSPDVMFVYHRVLLALAGIGLVAMALKRRWEVVVIGLLVLGITAVGGLTLAVPRRALPLMPMVLAFTARAAVVGGAAPRAGAERSRRAGRAARRRRARRPERTRSSSPTAPPDARPPGAAPPAIVIAPLMELSALRILGLPSASP